MRVGRHLKFDCKSDYAFIRIIYVYDMLVALSIKLGAIFNEMQFAHCERIQQIFVILLIFYMYFWCDSNRKWRRKTLTFNLIGTLDETAIMLYLQIHLYTFYRMLKMKLKTFCFTLVFFQFLVYIWTDEMDLLGNIEFQCIFLI